MAKERKKVKPKPVKDLIPKKRPALPKKVVAKKKLKEIPIEEEPEPAKEYKLPFKVFKICEGASHEERKAVGERVHQGELTFLYYGVDGNKGCHHYIVNK